MLTCFCGNSDAGSKLVLKQFQCQPPLHKEHPNGVRVLNGYSETMRFELLYAYLRKFLVLSILSLAPLVANGQNGPINPASKMLPERLGEFRAAGRIEASDSQSLDTGRDVTSAASRTYVSKDGQRFSLTLFTSDSDAAAYSGLARRRARLGVAGQSEVTSANVGTDGFSYRDGTVNNLAFFKGPALVAVRDDGKSRDAGSLLAFGRTLAETLDKGEGDIPVLMKHLPGWPSVRDPLYVINQQQLKNEFNNQGVLDAVSFEGGTEAAIANYQGIRLVLIEFKTPQLATDNDARIAAKIQELRNQGQSLPAAYRRVGNYSVFVFDAANDQAANQLIDQVKYQQVVQWLGRNPNLYDRAANEFTRTTLGVFIAVVKASGLAIIGSLALGGLLGAFLFRLRRKQQRLAHAYSDAGGMLRLNIDELNTTRDTARLIGPGH
jgi:hypothetical protein